MLCVPYCSLRDDHLEYIAQLRYLVQLDLSYSAMITDVGLKYLADMRLKYLALNGCIRISGVGLVQFREMPLEELYLYGL